MKRFFLMFSIIFYTFNDANAGVSVSLKHAGDLVELPCLSNDKNHRFSFWQLIDEQNIIGPGNEFDEMKYNYEVLSGKLFIRDVSTKDTGFYRCISRKVDDPSSFNVHIVELIIKKDLLEATESTYETNLLRGMAAAAAIVVAIALALLIVILRRKQKERFFDVENQYANSSKFNPSSNIPKITVANSEAGIDNQGMEIHDYPKTFK